MRAKTGKKDKPPCIQEQAMRLTQPSLGVHIAVIGGVYHPDHVRCSPHPGP